MELNLELLSIQNPWWTRVAELKRTGQSLKFDPVIEAYHQKTLKWQPPVIKQLDLTMDKVYSIFGARGVGKTTMLKLLIEQLIDKQHIHPDNIFYYSCHNLETYEQLNELIKIFLSWRKRKVGRKYIFIDEITLIKNWHRGINYLIKARRLKNVAMILTGSVAPDFRKLTNNSIGEEKIITSLDFKEFLSLINPQLFKKVKPSNFLKFHNQLDYYLDIYNLCGGFISGINSYKEHGAVKQQIYSNYLYWLIADMAKLGRDIILVRQIIEQLMLNLGQPLGYKTIASKTKAKTHLTVADYLKILELIFATKLVYQADAGKPTTRKAKKVYFRDPFLFWLFYSYIYGSVNYWQFSREHLHKKNILFALVETVVFSHLIKNEQVKNWGQQVTFWRDNIHKLEINFLVHHQQKVTPILIRYGASTSLSTSKNLFKKAGFNQGIIISHNQLDLKGIIKIMPLTYWLMFGRGQKDLT